MEPWVAPRLARRRRGDHHPIEDFLFDYYPYRPGQLRRWHPGLGTELRGGDTDLAEYLRDPNYEATDEGVRAAPSRLARHAERLDWTVRLLDQTQRREPAMACFGLHEWAMAYRLPAEQVRHADWPLRLPADEVVAVVDDLGLRCTHFDAYRFFTPAAAPLNLTVLSRQSQPRHEQPGCLHATMDLYKHSFWFSPFISSDLVADAFELARDAREVDMRSSPYDVALYGLDPIRVETASGRAEFVAAARELTARAAGVRDRLLASLRSLLGTGTA